MNKNDQKKIINKFAVIYVDDKEIVDFADSIEEALHVCNMDAVDNAAKLDEKNYAIYTLSHNVKLTAVATPV